MFTKSNLIAIKTPTHFMIFQMCVKCQQPMSNGFDDYADDDEQYDEVMGRLGKDANVTNS